MGIKGRRFSGQGERGQTLVEFALVFPLLMLMLLGVVELGRGIYYYNSLSNLAREGARSGVVISTRINPQTAWDIDGNHEGTYSGITAYAGANTIVGNVASKAVAFDLSRMIVIINHDEGAWRNMALPLEVRVQYPFESLITNWIGSSPTITLTAQTTMRIE